jgi:hypothetical protein
MNYVGKALVLVNLGLSVLFLVIAAALFLRGVDWGRKEPRTSPTGELVPPEIDKRTALIKEVGPAVLRAQAAAAQEQKRLAATRAVLVANHEWYEQQLRAVAEAPSPVRQIPGADPGLFYLKYDKDRLVTDPGTERPELDPARPVSFTDPDKKVMRLDKSIAGYRGDLRTARGQIEEALADTRKWLKKQEEVTVRLDGTKDEASGAVIRPGLELLLRHEHDVQQDIKGEIVYLRPLWVRELVDAQLLLDRQEGLRARLAELKAVRAARR